MTSKTRLYPKKETPFIKEFMIMLERNIPEETKIWFFKSHGEPMQVRGVPDILMCFGGLFVALEFKIMRNGRVLPTPLQEYTIDLINKASGTAVIIWYDEANTNVGVGGERFQTKKEAIDYLVSLLMPMVMVIKRINTRIQGIG